MFNIKVLVRAAEKVPLFESFGVQAEVGSYSELDKLESLASEADFIFSFVRVNDAKFSHSKHADSVGCRRIVTICPPRKPS